MNSNGDADFNNANAFMATEIPPLELPKLKDFEAKIRVEDIPKATQSELKMLAALSVVEQMMWWQAGELVKVNGHLRQMQAAMIEQHKAARKIREEQKQSQFRLNVFKFVSIPIFGGLVAAWAKKLIDRIF